MNIELRSPSRTDRTLIRRMMDRFLTNHTQSRDNR